MANTTGKKFGGRKKGTPNKDNELKVFLLDLVSESQPKLKEELESLKGKAFVDALMALMEYVQPKLSRAEVKATVEALEVSEYEDMSVEDLKKIEAIKNKYK